MSFSELKLIEPLCRALKAERYERPTPIQQKAVPVVLEGRDLLGCAQTGTGKTAAFVLPILQRLDASRRDGKIRALVLAPTRELAAQIDERVSAYGKHLRLRHTVIFGGVSQNRQVRELRPAPAVLVATPGRLLDLVSQRLVDLSGVEVLVLDEADRMLDMGFIKDVKRIVSMTPTARQTLLFSATMPRDIVDLARSILKDPVRIDVAPASRTPDLVKQSVYFVARADKRSLLERLLRSVEIERALVFTRTKRGASRVARLLDGAGIRADAIHGDKTQGARTRALSDFKRGSTRVLVATDIAARGIDVDGVSHVINYDMPDAAESYVHRIGRTGRAGASGIALSFCDHDERGVLKDIERLMGARVPVAEGQNGAAPRGPAPREASRNGSSPQRPNGNAPQREFGHGPAKFRSQSSHKGKHPPLNGGDRAQGGAMRPDARGGNVQGWNSSRSPNYVAQSTLQRGPSRPPSRRRRTSSGWS
jgi:ATP-dependent RNA helicase RhlE